MPSWVATCSTMQRNPPEMRKTFTLRWCNLSTSSLYKATFTPKYAQIKINQLFRLKNVSFEILDADDAIFVQQGGHVRKLKSAPTYLIPGVSWGGWSVISLFTCSREHLIIDSRSVRAVLNVTDPPMALRVLGTKIIWSATTHMSDHMVCKWILH